MTQPADDHTGCRGECCRGNPFGTCYHRHACDHHRADREPPKRGYNPADTLRPRRVTPRR